MESQKVGGGWSYSHLASAASQLGTPSMWVEELYAKAGASVAKVSRGIPLAVPRSQGETQLLAKEVGVEGGARYIVSLNEEQAKKNAADRQAVVAALNRRLKKGDKALVGNSAYRRYLRKALQERCKAAGLKPQRDDILRDLDRLQEATVNKDGTAMTLRTPAAGCAGKLFKAVGIALPPNIRDSAA